MQFITIITALFAASTATAVALTKRDPLYCGTQPYFPQRYTCYGNLLCPITDGIIYQPCGPACFNPANYGCQNGQLVPVGNCNGQVYDKNSYVCIGNQLCPITHPNACGTACYKLSEYKCVNGQLQQQ